MDGAEQDLLSEAEAQQLLDMAAAGSEPEAFVVLSDGSDMDPEAQDSDPGPLDWIDENGRVAVEQKLLEDLGAEVARHIKSAEKQRLKPDPQGWHRCPACPFRGFRGSARVASHLRTYHTEKKQFVCSGTKQMRIVLSLHDTDMLQGVRRGNYLRRSAQVLRRTVQPPLPRSKNAIDRSLRLLLRANGPVFVNERTVKQGGEARRLGKLWYTHDFAEKIFQEMLLNHAKVGIETESLEARESK